MHFHQLHFVLLNYCVSVKKYTEMPKKMQTCSSWRVNLTHFHKTFKVVWEQDAVLSSKSNTLRYKKENRKKFSAAAAMKKKIKTKQNQNQQQQQMSLPPMSPPTELQNGQEHKFLYKHLLPFSPFKKLHSAFLGLI